MADELRRTILIPQCKFSPTGFLDVGANNGEWAKEMKTLFPGATFFLIEGNEYQREKLQQTGFKFDIALISNQIENVTFYRSKTDKDGTGY